MYRKILENLEAWRTSVGRKPLILKGARQVGKTYILREWGESAFASTHYINFESNQEVAKVFERDLDVRRMLADLALFVGKTIDPDKDLLIFDEIQLAPKALTALKYFCEDLPQLAICCAGSLLGVSLAKESFPVGKVSFMYMHPMSFCEFLRAVDSMEAWKRIPEPTLEADISPALHEYLWQLLRIYYVVGGMPAAVKAYLQHRDDRYTAWTQVRSIQRDLIMAYESDFAKHAGKVNATHIQVLFRNVPQQLADYHDDSTKRFRFTDIMPGKKGFGPWERPLHWLINAGLVLQTKIANRAEVPLEHFCRSNIFKLYAHDVGLLGCLQDIEPDILFQQDYGLAKGYFAENFVAQEMRAAHADRLWPLYAWHEGESQIEFVRSTAIGLVPIEVKAGFRTKAKSLQEFIGKYHPKLAIKITANPMEYRQDKGYLHLPLYLAGWSSSLRLIS
jgi:predicted AAA+ superfamily ATPase